MKVGDLVGHKFEDSLGVVLRTPETSNTGDYLVQFANRTSPGWYRKKYLRHVTTIETS